MERVGQAAGSEEFAAHITHRGDKMLVLRSRVHLAAVVGTDDIKCVEALSNV